MTEKSIKIENRLGLHARAAARFVEKANQFESTVQLVKGNAKVDGKSILGLLTLAAAKGTSLQLLTDGPDEVAASTALIELIKSRFGEQE